MLFKRDNLEYEFLPPALEIEETPPSPLGRFVIIIIFIMVITAIIWSYFSKIDEVAIARGKIIPEGKIKVIQPMELSSVNKIYVTEGEKVKEGQLLIELDSTIKQVDIESLKRALEIAKLEKEIFKAELQGEDIDALLKSKNLSAEIIELEKRFKDARDSEYKAKEDALKLIISQRESDLGMANANLVDIEKKLDKAKKDEGKLKEEYESGSSSKKDWEAKKDEVSTLQTDYDNQLMKIDQAKEKIEEAKKNLEESQKGRHTNTMNLIVEREKKIGEIESELTKEAEKIKYQKIYSPVTGTVQGLNSNTIGGVVTPAQPIMTIVPDGTPLVVEAMVLNKDIGFINMGQKCEVKFDTFPFQRYGTVNGMVISISPDAFEDEKIGPVYKIKVKLDKSKIFVINKYVDIISGMSITTEVKTGKRRVIEFFLDPFVKHVKESLTDR